MCADGTSGLQARTNKRDVPCRTLAEYIRALLDALSVGDPGGYARMRTIVQNRRAIIEVDDEVVEVLFDGPAFRVDGVRTGKPVAGTGRTRRQTVVDLLQGRIEVSEAIISGHLDVNGKVDDIARMFHALQVLVDSSTRVPRLQELARDYLADPCAKRVRVGAAPHAGRGRGPLAIKPLSAGEADMLRRLDLLP